MAGIKISNMEECAGCLLCMMACSFYNTGSFGLADAKIQVDRIHKQNRYRITVSDDCLECGSCVEYCHFGILSEGGEGS